MNPSKTDHPLLSLEAMVADIDGGLKSMDDTPGEKTDAPSLTAPYGGQQYIRFMLDDILLAIPLWAALEIGSQPRVTPLPNLPGWVMGVTNIRGEIISIVDLKAFFGISVPRPGRTQRFIIIHNREMKVGILADRIIGIFSSDRSHAEGQRPPYPDTDAETTKWASYISELVPLEEGVMNILDVEKLLASPQMNAFRSE